jgi:hypothetical protein
MQNIAFLELMLSSIEDLVPGDGRVDIEERKDIL